MWLPNHIEGYQAADWIVMDYGDVVVHIFHDQAREYYSLEKTVERRHPHGCGGAFGTVIICFSRTWHCCGLDLRYTSFYKGERKQ